jgi:CubicO group peptidase (beta-lactamase class C family)
VAAVDWFAPTARIGEGDEVSLRVAAAGEQTITSAALDRALAYARSMNSYGLIVAHRSVIQLEYYREGFGAQRLLDSQSLHKPLAAILTMAAVADGLLTLDDPLGRYVPEWRHDPRGSISVRDVLYMQTGLAVPPYEQGWESPGYRMFITSHLREAVLEMQLESPPGTHFRSHYAATQLLQLVLEAATGTRYADFLHERLWTPLQGGEARVRLDRPGGNAQVFCCLQARPRDWLRVGLMLARRGVFEDTTVLPREAFLQLTAPSPLAPNVAMQQIWRGSPYAPIRSADSRNPARGLRMSAPFAAEDVLYLEGRGGQRVYVVPSRDLVVVRQGEIRMDWDDAAFLNGILQGVPESRAFSVPPASSAANAGSAAN